MNAKSTTSRIGIAAAIAGFALAATACGTEQASEPDRAGQPPAKTSLPPSRISPRAAEQEDLARARAEHADALRWAHGHRTADQPAASQRAASDRAAEAERAARAERADALRWAHGN